MHGRIGPTKVVEVETRKVRVLTDKKRSMWLDLLVEVCIGVDVRIIAVGKGIVEDSRHSVPWLDHSGLIVH